MVTHKDKKRLEIITFILIISIGVLFLHVHRYSQRHFAEIDGVTSASVIPGDKTGEAKIVEAQYYEQLNDNRVKCTLCPKVCLLREEQRGFCKVRKNISGKLYNTDYGKAVLHYHGSSQVSAYSIIGVPRLESATAACSMRCSFCITGNSLFEREPDDNGLGVIFPEEISKIKSLYEDEHKEKINLYAFSATEPFISYEYTSKVIDLVKNEGMDVVLVSSGHIQPKPFIELSKKLLAIVVSLKGFSKENYKRLTTGDRDVVLNNLKLLKENNIPFIISYILIPTITDSDEEIRDMAVWVKENLGEYTPVDFICFFPSYRLKNLPPTSLETVTRAINIAKKTGLKFVQLQIHHQASTNFEKVVEAGLNKMNCPYCGKMVAGFEIIDGKIEITRHLKKDYSCEWCGKKIWGGSK